MSRVNADLPIGCVNYLKEKKKKDSTHLKNLKIFFIIFFLIKKWYKIIQYKL